MNKISKSCRNFLKLRINIKKYFICLKNIMFKICTNSTQTTKSILLFVCRISTKMMFHNLYTSQTLSTFKNSLFRVDFTQHSRHEMSALY